MPENLSSQVCTACRGDADKLGKVEIRQPMDESHNDCDLVDNHHNQRQFDSEIFQEALEFVNQVGEVAEEKGHHQEIEFTWGEATVRFYTHKIDALHDNDFICAAKVDELV